MASQLFTTVQSRVSSQVQSSSNSLPSAVCELPNNSVRGSAADMLCSQAGLWGAGKPADDVDLSSGCWGVFPQCCLCYCCVLRHVPPSVAVWLDICVLLTAGIPGPGCLICNMSKCLPRTVAWLQITIICISIGPGMRLPGTMSGEGASGHHVMHTAALLLPLPFLEARAGQEQEQEQEHAYQAVRAHTEQQQN
jgi:hypothetical protein